MFYDKYIVYKILFLYAFEFSKHEIALNFCEVDPGYGGIIVVS